MKKERTKHLEFVIGDWIMIFISSLFGCYLWGFSIGTDIWKKCLEIGIFLIILTGCVIFFEDGYSDILRRGYLLEFFTVCRQMGKVFVIELIYLFLNKNNYGYSRKLLLTVLVFSIFFIYLERLINKKWLSWRFSKVKYARNVIIIGNPEQILKIIRSIRESVISAFQITAVCLIGDDGNTFRTEYAEIEKIPENELMDYVRNHVIDEVFISIADDSEKEKCLIHKFLGIGILVHVFLEQNVSEFSNIRIEILNGMNVLTCYNKEISLGELFCKRALDIAGAAIGLFLTAIIAVIIGPIIYISSPGPIIFSQTRVGRNGRKFKIYKFRSMYLDAEKRKEELIHQNQMDGYMFKMKNDPRIIKGIGTFIRNTSLDEFPQFLNVLKGDMSLVGTRPPTVDEYEKYEFTFKKRLCLKPGITGLWQISGRNQITDFSQVIQLDTQYIDHWSLYLDIKILLLTIVAVLKRKGAQ